MRILITTPAGRIGRRILPELLAPEFSVRVISRHPNQLPAGIQQEVEIVRGSTDDVDILRRALEDMEALFWCIPRLPFEERSAQAHYERFARAASLAIRETGTPRVVAISAAGEGLAPTAERSSGWRAIEEILNQSGAAIRHLRCAWFTENLVEQTSSTPDEGMISYPVPGDIPIRMRAIRDLADVVLRWLVRRDWSGIESIAIPRPQDFSNLSFTQSVAAIDQTVEYCTGYEEIAPEH
jgi:uncharacterized protein YbjT (DUF2867 family)